MEVKSIRKIYKSMNHRFYTMEEGIVLPKIDLSSYIGQWVVICDNKVVAHDKDLTKISKKVSKCKRSPTITKIPKNNTLIF